MATRMPPRPRPEQLQAALVDHLVRPALEAVSGRDARTTTREAARISGLPGAPALAAPIVDAYFDETGFGSSLVDRVAAGAGRLALGVIEQAKAPDGTVDAARLPPHLQAAFHALGGVGAPAEGPRFSRSVLTRVMRVRPRG